MHVREVLLNDGAHRHHDNLEARVRELVRRARGHPLLSVTGTPIVTP